MIRNRLLGLIIILNFTIIINTNATIYYLAADGNDSNNGTTEKTAFKSIGKINTLTLKAGDQILFKKGEVFRGQLNIIQSGTATNPILIDSYGTGANAVINGSVIVTDWKQISRNIWQANCAQASKIVTGVYSNSLALALGRYPNYSDANKGYNTILSHSGKNKITSKEPLTIDWTGGEIVCKTMQWVLDKSTISTSKGNVLSFNETDYEPQDNWGYFIQNHPATLDQEGEWYYDPVTKTIRLFSTKGNPQTKLIEATVFSKGINITGSNVSVKNIQIEKTLNYGVYVENSSNITIQNLNIIESGENAIQISGFGSNITIENCNIRNVNNNAVVVNAYKNFIFRANTLKNIGLIPGRGKGGDGQYFGLQYSADNIGGVSIIENCVLDSLGYVGIDFRCSNITIQKNRISNYDLIKDDGGGIYTYNDFEPKKNFTNQKVLSNIVYNAVGSLEGVYNGYQGACGIYMDDCSQFIEIRDNTVFNCSGEGLMLHTVNNVTATNNTIFNNGKKNSGGQFLMNLSNCGETKSNIIENNIFFSKTDEQEIARLEHQTNDLSKYGKFDNNFYCRPFDESLAIKTVFAKVEKVYDLACWKKSKYGKDANSKITPIQYKPYAIKNISTTNLVGNGTFNNNINGLYCWTPEADCSANWDNTAKIDGGSLKITPGKQSPTYAVIKIGSVTKSQNYALKFTTLATSKNCKSIGVFLRQSGNDYSNLTPVKNLKLNDSRTEYEVLFSAPDSEANASIVFELNSESGTVWLDNINLSTADVIIASPSDSILFYYNDTFTEKIIALPNDREFIDVQKVVYASSIKLEPFTSKILMYQKKTIGKILLNEENDLEKTILLYSNPSNNSVKLSYSLSKNENIKISLTSVLGKEVMLVFEGQQQLGPQKHIIDTTTLKNGMYFVNVNGKQTNKKLIIEH